MPLVEITLNWFRSALQWRGSVAPTIIPRVLLFSGFGVLVTMLDAFSVRLPLDFLGDLTTNVVCNLVLGLLLVFRTNTAYDRYWEGRKAWGAIVVNTRNLAREISVAVEAIDSTAQAEKAAVLLLLSAFAIATKLHLRRESSNQELEPLLPSSECATLAEVPNRPLQINLWLGAYLQQQFQLNRLDAYSFAEMKVELSNLIEGLTNCERILTTPVPLAYSIYLKRLILIYCLSLPFGLVATAKSWTGLVVGLISFILLGIEEIGGSIEDPFGYDTNDLPLDDICQTVAESVKAAIELDETNKKLPVSAATHASEGSRNG